MLFTQSFLLEEWIQLVLMGALFGLIGQMARTALGIRKMARTAGGMREAMENSFSRSQLLLSLMLGTLAGVVAVFTMPGLEGFSKDTTMPSTVILAIISAGYAGGDFLEGVVKSQLSK